MSLNYLVKVKWLQPSLVTPGLHPLPSALSPAVELEVLSLPSSGPWESGDMEGPLPCPSRPDVYRLGLWEVLEILP